MCVGVPVGVCVGEYIGVGVCIGVGVGVAPLDTKTELSAKAPIINSVIITTLTSARREDRFKIMTPFLVLLIFFVSRYLYDALAFGLMTVDEGDGIAIDFNFHAKLLKCGPHRLDFTTQAP